MGNRPADCGLGAFREAPAGNVLVVRNFIWRADRGKRVPARGSRAGCPPAGRSISGIWAAFKNPKAGAGDSGQSVRRELRRIGRTKPRREQTSERTRSF